MHEARRELRSIAALTAIIPAALLQAGCAGNKNFISPEALNNFSCAKRHQAAVVIKNILPGKLFDTPDAGGTVGALSSGQMSLEYIGGSSSTVVKGSFSESETGSSLDPPDVTETSYGKADHTIIIDGYPADDYITAVPGSISNTTTFTIACN